MPNMITGGSSKGTDKILIDQDNGKLGADYLVRLQREAVRDL